MLGKMPPFPMALPHNIPPSGMPPFPIFQNLNTLPDIMPPYPSQDYTYKMPVFPMARPTLNPPPEMLDKVPISAKPSPPPNILASTPSIQTTKK
jgi:hypothetical protein